MLNSTRALHIEGEVIEVKACDGWQAANELCCPLPVQAQIKSRICNDGIRHCDGYTASNGIEYRWYPAPLQRPSRWRAMWEFVPLAVTVALLGFLLGTGARCFESWRAGGSADPRCAYFHWTGYVEVHRFGAGADRISCEYRPHVGAP